MLAGKADPIAAHVVKVMGVWLWIQANKMMVVCIASAAIIGVLGLVNFGSFAWASLGSVGGSVCGGLFKAGGMALGGVAKLGVVTWTFMTRWSCRTPPGGNRNSGKGNGAYD